MPEPSAADRNAVSARRVSANFRSQAQSAIGRATSRRTRTARLQEAGLTSGTGRARRTRAGLRRSAEQNRRIRRFRQTANRRRSAGVIRRLRNQAARQAR